MKKTKFLTGILLLCVLTVFTACKSSKPEESEKGQETDGKIQENTETAAEEEGFQSFTAYDLEGNEVSQDIFQDYDLTMINIWATFCGPCISEMPELGELNQEYREKGVQVVGIVMDVLNSKGEISEDQVSLAKEIVEKTGADYLHLLPSDDLIEIKLKEVTGVPETVFVDKDGRLVGASYIGARDGDSWRTVIDELLEEVKN